MREKVHTMPMLPTLPTSKHGKTVYAKVIAVDFDGTLCVSKWPEIGEPNMAIVQRMTHQIKNRGARGVSSRDLAGKPALNEKPPPQQ